MIPFDPAKASPFTLKIQQAIDEEYPGMLSLRNKEEGMEQLRDCSSRLSLALAAMVAGALRVSGIGKDGIDLAAETVAQQLKGDIEAIYDGVDKALKETRQ